MTTLLKANKYNKDVRVKGSFETVVKEFSKKPNTEILDCRIDDTFKNKAIWVDGFNMATIIHPDNEK